MGRRLVILTVAGPAIFMSGSAVGEVAEVPQLQLEAKISLGSIQGRIDHMAVDLARHRLFVAALGNHQLAVVDLEARRLDRVVANLPEPQGVGYDPVTDTLYVANAGDGSVRFFKGCDLSPDGQIDLGSDADNVRVERTCPWRFIRRAFSSTQAPIASLSTCPAAAQLM